MTNMTTFARNKTMLFPAMAQGDNSRLDQNKTAVIGGFKRAKLVAQTKDLSRKIRITFYRTKPGCYCPSPYQLKYRELSEVLK